jgi:hypothetical protein
MALLVLRLTLVPATVLVAFDRAAAPRPTSSPGPTWSPAPKIAVIMR